MNSTDNEQFAVSPEDVGPDVPPELAPKPGLKKRIIPDPPEIDQSEGRRTLWFLIALGVTAFVVMLAVGALNVVVDPYGLIGTKLLPTVTTSDRTIKADAIEKLMQPPQLVVLGSSRSMRYEPAYLEQKTGLHTFNAGVNGIGGTADAWAFVNYFHQVWPQSDPAYFWLLDVESFVPFKVQGRLANEPRLAQFVGGAATGTHKTGTILRNVWDSRSSVFSLVTAKESLRVLLNRGKVAAAYEDYRKRFSPDGSLVDRPWTEGEWNRRFPKSVKRYSDLYRNAYHKLDPEAQLYFEKTLKFMNDQGATPLIVLTPINPKLLKVVGPLGWYTRHRQVVDYVKSLQGKYHFVFVDITDITKFGADPQQFYDGVHMTQINTRRAIDYVLKQTGGIPQ